LKIPCNCQSFKLKTQISVIFPHTVRKDEKTTADIRKTTKQNRKQHPSHNNMILNFLAAENGGVVASIIIYYVGNIKSHR